MGERTVRTPCGAHEPRSGFRNRAVYSTARRIPGPGPDVPVVEFDNETSDVFTIIDITARDMVGFLYRVTKTLFELNLDIGSAKIVTQGSRVMDSFYVTDLLRQKINRRRASRKDTGGPAEIGCLREVCDRSAHAFAHP